MDFRQRARERAIADEIANELHRVLGPLNPEDLEKNSATVGEVFGRVFDRHGIIDEAPAAQILARVPKELAALNLPFADLNRKLDSAIRTSAPRAVTNDCHPAATLARR
jgi:hypothetical protein